jgi:transcriptional regulator with XRE-family HTH domain
MAKAQPENPLRSILAENMRARRRALGLSQEALAAECGLHRTYVGAVERAERNVSLDNIAKLAVALRLRPWELLRKTDPL